MVIDLGPNAVVIVLAVLAALPGIYAARAAHQANKHAEQARDSSESTGERVDGRMDELLTLTRSASHAEGQLAERPPVQVVVNGPAEPPRG